MAQLEVSNLSFSYSGADAPTLSGISFSVEKGQFVAICGATGSGKTTLLRCLKRELTPLGQLSGEIRCSGQPLSALDERTAARSIGFVMQRPEEQIVTDKVWHELAFGLESLGYDTPTIRRRVAEIAAFFGIAYSGCFYSVIDVRQTDVRILAIAEALSPAVILTDVANEAHARKLFADTPWDVALVEEPLSADSDDNAPHDDAEHQ